MLKLGDQDRHRAASPRRWSSTVIAAALRELQYRYADSLPDGCYEPVDSAHFIQAEQPTLVATRVQELLPATG